MQTERKLTKPEAKAKERIVKDLKGAKADFKKRYGKDAEAVMYATATKRAKKIAEAVFTRTGIQCRIDTNFYRIDGLEQALKKYTFVIGTRLHMCLLSMLNGIPAFNISYELKGRECFSALGLERLTIDYNDHKAESLKKLSYFLANYKKYRKGLRLLMTQQATQAEGNFIEFIKCIQSDS